MKRKATPKSPSGKRQKGVEVDLKAICSIDHECTGCSDLSKSCCAKYDVCVGEAELKRIIPFLNEAAKLCPHLKTEDGYANVFEEEERGQYSIETDENDLCLFAYADNGGMIRCSLHSVEDKLAMPRGSIKPAVCILYPLTFSDAGNVLTLHDDALGCECSSLRKKPSSEISPALLETIRHFGGEVSTSPG